MRAVALGETAARIDLAYLHFFMGEQTEGKAELSHIQPETLSPLNQALYHLSLSYCFFQNDHPASLREALAAWKHIQSAPEFVFVAPEILSQIAGVYHFLHKKQQCIYHLERAREICVTPFKWAINLNMGICFYEAGDFTRASSLFNEVLENSVRDFDLATAQLGLGRVLYIMRQHDRAIEVQEKSRLSEKHFFRAQNSSAAACCPAFMPIQKTK